MLILQRKAGDSIRIGEDVYVTVVSVEKGRVRLAIDAPIEIPIVRTELLENIAVNKESVVDATSTTDLLEFLGDVKELKK